jgi:hypothetical protein
MAAIQCAECGRFCGEADFASGYCHYTPESEFTRERIEWTCRRCAAARIEALEQRVSELEEALQEAVSYHDGPTYAWILRAKQVLAKARNEQVKQ